MKISYEEIGHMSVTFPGMNCAAGQVCKINTAGNAAPCSAGDKFLGVVEAVNDATAAVQVEGFVTVPYSGTKPACGYTALSANGAGGVKADANGKSYWVVAVNETKLTVTIKL